MFDLRHIIALAGIGTTIVVLVIITMILSVWCIRNNLASASRGEQLKWASQNGPFHSGGLGNQYVSNHSPGEKLKKNVIKILIFVIKV